MKLARRGLFRGLLGIAASSAVEKAAKCLPIARAAVGAAASRGYWTFYMWGAPPPFYRIEIPKTPASAPIVAPDGSFPVPHPENAS